MAEWYWMRDGQKHGPVDTAHLKQMARAGRLEPADMIWREGLPNWVPASQTSGLEFGQSSKTHVPDVRRARVSQGTIKYRCAHCGSILESEGHLAGKQDKCPSCGKPMTVPYQSTAGAAAFFRRIPKGVYIGWASVLLIGIVTLALWLTLRDTWERDHGAELREMSEQTIALSRAGQNEEGVATYEAMVAFVGDRQLEDPQLRQAFADARRIAEPVQQRLQEQRRQAELKHREAENLAKLHGLESQAKAFIESGDLQSGIDKCQQALNFIRSSQTDNPEFVQAIRRLTEITSEAQARLAKAERDRKLHEQLLTHAEQALSAAKQMEQQQDYRGAVAKYQEVIDIVRNRQLSSESSGTMLVQAEAGKKRAASHLSFTVTVSVINSLGSGTVPRWSVDHELRVNGRVVDRMTNTSAMVEFVGIEAKVGDKITARSMWKNGYGAVGTTLEYSPQWPIADIDNTKYTILLYEDEIAYRVAETMRREGRD